MKEYWIMEGVTSHDRDDDGERSTKECDFAAQYVLGGLCSVLAGAGIVIPSFLKAAAKDRMVLRKTGGHRMRETGKKQSPIRLD